MFGLIFFVLVGLRTQVVREHLIPHTYLQALVAEKREPRDKPPPYQKDIDDALAARTATRQNLTLTG